MPVVRIAPWIDSLSEKPSRWVYIYSRKHLNPDGISLTAIKRPYFFTKNIYVTARGVLIYNQRYIFDPQMDHTQYLRETVPIWTRRPKISPRWICEAEVFTKVHLTINDDIDEMKYYNENVDFAAHVNNVYSYHDPSFGNEFMSLTSNFHDYAQEAADRFRLARKVVKTEVEKQQKELRDSGKTYKEFKIGDLVWLSIPLKTDSRSASKIQLPKKFKFRWAGPMRIISESVDNNRFVLVETFPDGSVIARHANAARMRPYTMRLPIDSAERAAATVADDFDAEIKRWEDAHIHQKAPKYRFAAGTNPELLKRYEAEYLDREFEDQECLIEMLVGVKYDKATKLYSYNVKWLGFAPHYNQWKEEDEIPKHFVVDFWESIRLSNPRQYNERIKWSELPKTVKRKTTSKKRKEIEQQPDLVVEIPLEYESDSD